MHTTSAAKCKILYIEDDSDDQVILGESLSDYGASASLVFADSGEEAINYLESLDAQSLPALIVLDLNMPRWSGEQTLSYIKSRQAYAAIPVVVFSTSNSSTDRQACFSLGARSYFQKPTHYAGYKEIAKTFINLMEC